MNYLDLIGASLSILGTYFFVKSDIRMWLVYILATIFNSILYFKYSLYATLLLEIVYFILSVYGLLYWYSLNEVDSIKEISAYDIHKFALYWLTIYIIVSNSSLTNIPLEACAISSSIIAYYLSGRKLLECWYVWIIADSLYAILMFQKQLYFHGLLFLIYLIFAFIGLKSWQKNLYKNVAT